MESLGITNTAGSKRFSFPVMSKEELLSFNPDVIFWCKQVGHVHHGKGFHKHNGGPAN